MTTRRMLVIDDEPDIRAIARLGLERAGGWTVYTAECGEGGIAVAPAEQPDAVLLDVMMPDSVARRRPRCSPGHRARARFRSSC